MAKGYGKGGWAEAELLGAVVVFEDGVAPSAEEVAEPPSLVLADEPPAFSPCVKHKVQSIADQEVS